jgi:ankyrin repeat protein
LLASASGYEKIVSILLGAGVGIDAERQDGTATVHSASYKGNEGAVKILLDAGADLEARGLLGLFGSALHAASGNGHTKVVQMLLGYKSDRDY